MTPEVPPTMADSEAYFSSPVHISPLIGRKHELSTIMTHYKACKGGRIRVVLAIGDPGIGKTHLLNEVAKRAAEDGAIILQGGASEAEGMPPYLPFVEALGHYIQVAPLLHTHSEGNPFFAEELLDGWIEEGALVQVQEHHQWIAIAPLDHALPRSIRSALWQRFAHVSEQSIDHLRIAAIIGRTFDLWLLADVLEQEIEAVEECLIDAVHTRLIRSNQRGTFTFNHDPKESCLMGNGNTQNREGPPCFDHVHCFRKAHQ